MEFGQEWQAFQRLDNAAVVDFLTSAAGAMVSVGSLDTKDSDNLRLVLSGIHTTADARNRSLLLELEAQKAEFLLILLYRYGSWGLCLNLIRHSLRPHVEEAWRILSNFGQALVKRAELLFNRAFFVYHAGVCQKQTLYSTVLIDFSELLAASCSDLQLCLEKLALMNPSDVANPTGEDHELDLAVAKAQGFSGLLSHSLPIHAEAEIKRNVAEIALQVADAATELSEQLAANAGTEATYELVSACEWLKAEAQRLGLIEFPKGDNLLAWEVRRQNLASSMHALNEALNAVVKASLSSLTQESSTKKQHIPESIGRRLTSDLIAAGTSPAKAREGVLALFRYLSVNNLSPREIIVGELSRIHPSLLPRTLETLTALQADTSLMALSGNEKMMTMGRARRLSEVFSQALTAAAPILILAFVVASCGLKTQPKSDLLELRPDIPFRPMPNQGRVGPASAPASSSNPIDSPHSQGQTGPRPKQLDPSGPKERSEKGGPSVGSPVPKQN